MSSPYQWLEKSLETIHQASWYRSVQIVETDGGPLVTLQGRSLINFASNDYLGLAGDERLKAAAIAAIRECGTGSTGSRLISGHRKLHQDLEMAIANLKGTQDALVFSSGYLANLGSISALVGSKDLILGDKYNHSSLKNGARLSGATVLDYLHNDWPSLKTSLELKRSLYRRCLILSESVFSMDGDICPLPELVDLAEEFDCMLLIDEAHATGVIGKTGAGSLEHWGYRGRDIIQVGTLSKALGSLGGYVAGSHSLIDYLKNRAATWIYTTGLSPADTAAALEAIKILQDEPQRLDDLWQNVAYLKAGLAQLKIKLLPGDSPIFPLVVPDAATALKLAQHLRDGGIFAPAIRPPTVPTSRLRISLMATHQRVHLDRLCEVLDDFYGKQ